jgi:hypothetical protein
MFAIWFFVSRVIVFCAYRAGRMQGIIQRRLISSLSLRCKRARAKNPPVLPGPTGFSYVFVLYVNPTTFLLLTSLLNNEGEFGDGFDLVPRIHHTYGDSTLYGCWQSAPERMNQPAISVGEGGEGIVNNRRDEGNRETLFFFTEKW